ncbi:hypothetical protein BDY19DRAFT_996232 [Irpex rosettiformis]|uniref:Uncharacterized protein n=1 Tax=Irpex rosettiformis TaxID=378272 RepID=A0ACB8TVH1_9APHY|nr:hypothetical protein BDY19DRAFT_996232 [Irpex rosettiformis]
MTLKTLRNMGKGLYKPFLTIGTDTRETPDVSDPDTAIPTTMPIGEVQEKVKVAGDVVELETTGQVPACQPDRAAASSTESNQFEVVKEATRGKALVTTMRVADDKPRNNGGHRREEVEASSKKIQQLEAEKEFLSETLDKARTANEKLREKMSGAAQTSFEKTAKLEEEKGALSKSLIEAKAACEKLSGRIAELDRTSSEKTTALENRCREFEARARTAQKDLLSTRKELTETTRAFETCKLEQKKIVELLEIRTAELRAAQASLGSPPSLSHGDIKRMVDHLNAEVFQMSALMADQFPFEDTRTSLHTERCQLAHDRISHMVGSGLAHAVRTCSHGEDDSTLVQIMIQAYIVERIWWICRMWGFSVDPTHASMLDDLHYKIFEKESQSTSARWRSLTKRYLSDGLDQESIIAALRDRVVGGIVDALVVAGVQQSVEVIEIKVRESFGERISGVVVKALELRKATGEDMTTSEFVILCAHDGDCFQRESMENTEEMGSSRKGRTQAQEGQPVLCTTELGLCRFERKTTEGAKGEIEKNVLLKAKVALNSMVEEFVRQQQQRQEKAAASSREAVTWFGKGAASYNENPIRFIFGSS